LTDTLQAPPRPWPVAKASRVGLWGRVAGVVVACACLGVLVIASRLKPSSAGHGTHQQLGFPPCGWVLAFNRPCPTCGMTTSFAHAVRMDLPAAAKVQPMGCLLAVLAGVVFWGGLHVACTGSRLGRMGATMLRPRTLWGVAALAAVAWAYRLATWPGGL
jgi:hypothetical protein